MRRILQVLVKIEQPHTFQTNESWFHGNLFGIMNDVQGKRDSTLFYWRKHEIASKLLVRDSENCADSQFHFTYPLSTRPKSRNIFLHSMICTLRNQSFINDFCLKMDYSDVMNANLSFQARSHGDELRSWNFPWKRCLTQKYCI